MTRFSRLTVIAFLSFLAVSPPAGAWGRKGHAAIANIAEANLTPATRAQVKSLLKNDLDAHGNPSGRTRLADVASWADEVRDVAPKYTYRGWHSRENPVCSQELGPCPSGACVDEKIKHYVAVLKDKRASPRERNEALKFVVHLVGDLHVPLHSGSNNDKTGHFPATLKSKTPRRNSSLHSLWDHDFVVSALKRGPISAKLEHTSKLPPDATTQWMLETRDLSRKHVYDPLPGFTCNTPFTKPIQLKRPYMKQAVPVVRTQIKHAGLRLAALLNETLAPQYHSVNQKASR